MVDAEVRSAIVVVANVDVPITLKVPFEVSDEVAVIEPPVIVSLVSEVKNAVTPFNSVAKRLELVLLIVTRLFIKPLIAKRFVVVLLVVVELVVTRPVIVAVSDSKFEDTIVVA